MQARRLFASPGPRLEIRTVDIPNPGPGQILVRVTHSQVSAGTEMNYFRQNPPGSGAAAEPIGYMAVGRIAALGPDVAGFSVGERVLTAGHHGDAWLVDLNDRGHTAWYIEKLPDDVSDVEAGFATLGDIALHGVRRAGLQIDESVAVFGVGLIGQLTVQFARLSGAYPIIAVDLYDSRLDKARQSGATHVVNASREDPVAAIRRITGGAGAETLFHCTPVASILQTIMEAAAERAVIILSGSAPGTAEIGLQVELLRRELSIIGNYEAGLTVPHAYWPWTRQRNRRACLRLLQAGELRLDHLISHVVPATEAQAMFEHMARGGDDWLGVVFTWE